MDRAAPETALQPDIESTQLAFSVAGSRRLVLSVNTLPEKVCDFLSYHIARQPDNLTVHVQRIGHAARHGLEDHLTGGLLDLFIMLGTRGKELRGLMLEQARGVLSEQSHAYFKQRLENGINAYDPIQRAGISVLSKGLIGSNDFMLESVLAEAQVLSPLEQALASIESSQLDDARAVLEESVLGGTSSSEEQKLLLDLYRKTGDQLHFSTLYANLSDEQNFAPEVWRALESHFDTSA